MLFQPFLYRMVQHVLWEPYSEELLMQQAPGTSRTDASLVDQGPPFPPAWSLADIGDSSSYMFSLRLSMACDPFSLNKMVQTAK